MQASTSEQYVISILLEEAVTRVFAKLGITTEELHGGFKPAITLEQRFASFTEIQASCMAAAP